MMKKNKKNITKKIILEISKKYIFKHGWNKNLFTQISNDKKINIHNLNSLFPEGYISLLKFYLENLNKDFILRAKKLNLNNLRVHIKVRELILLKLKLYESERQIIKKTYFALLSPKNFNISSYALYKTVDEIWFLAGDNSTDFNFYSKRAILASIYSSVIFYWINKNDMELTKKFLDKQLSRVSKIPSLKKNIKNFVKLPAGLKNFRKLFTAMQ